MNSRRWSVKGELSVCLCFPGCSQHSQYVFSGTVPALPVSTGTTLTPTGRFMELHSSCFNIPEFKMLHKTLHAASRITFLLLKTHFSLAVIFPGGLTSRADVGAEAGHPAASVSHHSGGVREQLAGGRRRHQTLNFYPETQGGSGVKTTSLCVLLPRYSPILILYKALRL